MPYILRFVSNWSVICRNVTARAFCNQSHSIPSCSEYDELINAAGRRRDFAAVRQLLSKRVNDGRLNTKRTFKFIAADVSMVDDLLQSLSELDDWFTRKHSHDVLVAQLVKLNRTAEALRVAETMARRRYGATATTFLPIFNALARRKEVSAAWRVVDAMQACNVRPVLIVYNYILTAHCSVGDVASAVETLVKMEAVGMKADSRTYDALVLGACRAGKVEAALAVMRRMLEDRLPALFSSYAHIIKEMVRLGYDGPALEFVRAVAGRNRNLDLENFGYLAKRLLVVKKIAAAKAVVAEMVEKSLSIGDELAELLLENNTD